MRKAKRVLALLLVFTMMFSNIGTTMIYATDVQNDAISQETEAVPSESLAEAVPETALAPEAVIEEEPQEETAAAVSPEATVSDSPAEEPQAADDDPAVYAIRPVEEETEKYATYNFYIKGELVDTQIIKNSGLLREPAASGQVFQGWQIAGKEDQGFIDFKKEVTVAEDGEIVTVNAVVEEKAYVMFLDEANQVVEVRSGKAGEKVDLDVTIALEAGTALKAWTDGVNTYENGTSVILPAAGETLVLVPEVVTAHWVTFDSAGGTSVQAVYVEGNAKVAKPADPTKDGYTFDGWYNGNTMFNFNTAITKDIVLTAHWTENTTVTYTVVFWNQSINNRYDAATKTYDYSKTSTERTGTRGALVPNSRLGDTTAPAGFVYNNVYKEETVNGKTVLNVYFDRRQVTYTFEWQEKDGRNTVTKTNVMVGLHGQPFSMYGYEWDTSHRWKQKGTSTTTTYLGEFSATDGDSVTFEGSSTANSIGTIYFHREGLNGNDTVESGKRYSGSFNVSEKYNGYTASAYNTDGGEDRFSTSAGKKIEYSGDLHIYFHLNSYTFEIRNNGEVTTQTVRYTDNLSKYEPETPTKDAKLADYYEFTGWYADPDCTTKFNFNQAMPAHNVVVYAGWAPKQITVEYNVNAKDVDWTFETEPTSAGTKVIKPDTDPVREGYTFAGWITEDGKPFNFNQPVTDNITLTAKWIKGGTFNIVYEVGTGTGADPADEKKYIDGSRAIVASGDELEDDKGNKFLYWETKNGAQLRSGAVLNVSADDADDTTITLTAVYADSIITVDVTYYSNYPEISGREDTTSVETQLKLFERFQVKQNPFGEVDYFKFIGWNTQADGKGTMYQPGQYARTDSEQGNEFYAQWERTAFSVYYVAAGNGTVETQWEPVEAGDYPTGSVTNPDEGYYFAGWYEDEDCTGEAVDITTVCVYEDTVYYAKFEQLREVEITFTAQQLTVAYDGAPHSASGGVQVSELLDITFDVTFTPGGNASEDDLSDQDGLYTVSGTSVGTYTGTITVSNVKCPEGYTAVFPEGESATVSLAIHAADFTVEKPDDVVYNGVEQKQEPVVKDASGKVLVKDEDYTLEWSDAVDAGTVTVTVTLTDRSNYQKDTQTTTYEITQRPLTLQPEYAEKIYDGTPLTSNGVEIVGGELALKTHHLKAGVAGERTEVGIGTSSVVQTGANKVQILDEDNRDITANYQIAYRTNDLKVTKRTEALMITVLPHEKVYDGEKWTASETVVAGMDYSYTGTLATGDELVVTLTGPEDINAGTYSGGITAVVQVMRDGEDVTEYYTVENPVPGTLTIEKCQVHLTSADRDKSYDGTVLTGAMEDLEGLDGFIEADREKIRVEPSGEQMQVGTSPNSFTVDVPEDIFGNYKITKAWGTLEVTANTEIEIVVTAKTASKTYDGTALTGETAGYEITVDGEPLIGSTLPTGDTIEVSVAGSVTNVAEGAVDSVPTVTIKHNGETVTTAYENITQVNGTLTIDPVELTLDFTDRTEKYNGAPYALRLRKESANLTSGFGLETDLVIYGTNVGTYVPVLNENDLVAAGQTAVLVTPVILRAGLGKVDSQNYTIKVEGSLTIEQQPDTYYKAAVSMVGWQYGDAEADPVSSVGSHLYDNAAITYLYESVDENFPYSSSEKPTAVGTYTVTASWASPDPANLPDLTATSETFEITPRPVSFVAEKTETYTGVPITLEAEDYALAEDSLALAYDDVIAVSDNAAITKTDVGAYTFAGNAGAVDGDEDVIKNYIITVNGALTIERAERPAGNTVSVTSYNSAYDALPHSVTVSGNTLPGDVTKYRVGLNGEWTEELPEYTDVANRTIYVQVTNPNYKTAEASGSVVITPVEVGIYINNATKQYGEPNPSFVSFLYPGVPGPGIEYTVKCDATATSSVTKPGYEYPIYAAYTPNPNYKVTVFQGLLTVTAADERPLAVTNYGGTYDGQPHSIEVAYTEEAGDILEYSTDGEKWSVEKPQFTDAVEAQPVLVRLTNPNYKTTTRTGTVTINPVELNIVTETYDDKLYDGTPLTAGGSVSWTDANGAVQTLLIPDNHENKPYEFVAVTDETLTITITGTRTDAGGIPNKYEINWGDAKAANYKLNEKIGNLTVSQKSLAADDIVIEGPKDHEYNGQPHKPEGLTVKYGETVLKEGVDYELAYDEENITDAGTIPVTIKGIINFHGETSTSYKITPKTLIVTSTDASKTYDGDPLSNPGEVAGFVTGEKATLQWASLTDEGSAPNKVAILWDDEDTTAKKRNYTVVNGELGTLTVTAQRIDPDAGEALYSGVTVGTLENVTYNGNDQMLYPEVLDAKNQLLELNKDYTVEFSSDVKNTGEVTVTVTGIGNYAGTVTRTYIIEPARLTVSSTDASKPYDGEPLSNEGSVSGFVDGEGNVRLTWASLTEVGEASNDVVIAWNGTTQARNYSVQKNLGTLRVVRQSIDPDDTNEYLGISVSQPENTVYNGLAQRQPVTVTDANGEPLTLGADYTVTYSENVMDAGTVTVTIEGAGSYAGTVTRTYQITPRPMTVTTASAEKVYDGTALTRTAGYMVSGRALGDNISIDVTGSQTAVGSSDNTYVINWGSVKAENYTITDNLGTLTVTTQSINPDAGDDEYMGVTVGTLGNVVYNGLAQNRRPDVRGANNRALMSGVDYTVTFSADTTNVGEVTATVTGIGNYAGTVTRTYRITPAPLTVNTESATAVFNGAALTAGGRVTGLVNGETVTLNITGSQTFVGISNNTYEIVWDNARESNYEIVGETLGTLTVLAAPAAPVAPVAPAAPAPQAEDDPAPVDIPENDVPLTPDPEVQESEPIEIAENDVPLAPSTEPEVETIDDNATPLAPGSETHKCCILHFVLLLLALCVELYYTHDRKKRQKHIYELRSEVGSKE